MARRFTRAQLGMVRRAVDWAEERTGSFYGVSTREWCEHPYDLLTAADFAPSGSEMLPGNVLASVSRVELSSRVTTAPRELYRIQVNDDGVLEVAARGGRGIDLESLLRYMVTHELIHVIRFALLHSRFDVGLPERDREEARVHRLTERVLAPVADHRLAPVVAAYRELQTPPCFS